ncbi:MAG: NADH-ubiquinone oxidoreductase-F iron-sulfur binding region domain-containing protein [Christensenellales bacterium]|jgi:ferredoxin
MTDLLEQIKVSGLREYGLYPEEMAQKLAACHGARALVVALNNADTEGAALTLLRRDAGKVFAGMKSVAQIIGTECKVLHIPAYADDLFRSLKTEAEADNIELVCGIVDVRADKDCCLTHIVTMVELSDITSGSYVPGVYVSVNGNDIRKINPDTRIGDLLGEHVKGVQTGYEVRTAEALQITVAQANIENGVLRAITDADCMIDLVQKKLLTSRKYSCGKCVFCREGLLQLEAVQKDVTSDKGSWDGLRLSGEIGEAMAFSTACSMGQNAARIALSAMKVYKEEYEEHIRKHRCVADSCIAFRKVYVDPFACTGCAGCRSVCPTGAIDGAVGYIHIIFDHWCTKCGDCIPVCLAQAIRLTTGRIPRLPDRMLRVGRFTE